MHMTNTSALIPIVIGVTGHRNPHPDVIAILEQKFTAVLEKIDCAAPNSPIVLLSPLAAGCDQIAARVALDFKRKKAGMRVELVVPMPLALDDYRLDFANDSGERTEFERLRALATFSFALPPFKGALDASGCISHQAMRNAHYRRLGLYVALQSQLMVAMWDGESPKGVGGTGEIVAFCRGKLPIRNATLAVDASVDEWARFAGTQIPSRPVTPLLSPESRTPHVVLFTPRAVSAASSNGSPERPDENERVFESICKQLRGELDPLNQALGRASVQYQSDFCGAVNSPRWEAVVARFERLDALANRAKKIYLCDAGIIALVAVLAICCFEFFSSFSVHWPVMVAYWGLLILSLMWYKLSERKRTEWIFVHSRGLAEAMRVQLGWAVAGIGESVADHYVARRGEELVSLRAQIRAASIELHSELVQSDDVSLKDSRTRWIDNQARYFGEDSGGMKRRRAADQRWSTCRAWGLRVSLCFSFILGLAVFLMAKTGVPGTGGTSELDELINWGCFIMGSLFALTVGIDYQRDVTLHREELEDARRMSSIFARAQALLGAAKDANTGEAILRAAGKEALDENAEWIVRHRGRLRAVDVG